MSEILHIPVDHELGDRVRWLIRVRWIVLGAAVVFLLAAGRALSGILPLGALWAVLGVMALYNVAFWVLASRFAGRTGAPRKPSLLMHMQVIADLVAFTALLHFSGGLENPFSVTYILPVLVGSTLMSRRDGFVYAALASVLWVGLLLAEANGILPHHNLVGFRLPMRFQQPAHIVSESLAVVTMNVAIAYFASSVMGRLREGERQLYEANASCELRTDDLIQLNERLRREEQELHEANSMCELRAGELAKLNERLREFDRSRSLFIRLVTHELRAPVAAIQSYLRLILDGYVPEDRVREIVGKAEQRARDQLDLISDLLDLARVQTVKEIEEAELLDVGAVLKDVLDLMQARANDKAQVVEVDVATEVPMVRVSREHMRQVWTNLVSNAIKYTPSGGHIGIALKAQGGGVYGMVRDTGIGMSQEELGHLFENFYRTEAAKAMSHQGTGLGLSIVQGIMQRYGGRIWVESEVGKGSTFHFELPPPSAAPDGSYGETT